MESHFLSREMARSSSGIEQPRYAVLSDIHANLEALTAVLHDAKSQRCTHHVCLGDMVGYNANPKECLELIRSTGMPCVKGNHDQYASTEDVLERLNERASKAIFWTRQQLSHADKQWLRELKYVRQLNGFTVVHATLDSPERWGYVMEPMTAAVSFTYQTTPVCFYGHTHLPVAFIRDGRVRVCTDLKFHIEPGRSYFINVGSVGEPRGQDPRAAYVIYDLSESVIEIRHVSYDVRLTDAKVQMAGLPARGK